MTTLKQRQEEWLKIRCQAHGRVHMADTAPYSFQCGVDSFRQSPEYLAMKEALEKISQAGVYEDGSDSYEAEIARDVLKEID